MAVSQDLLAFYFNNPTHRRRIVLEDKAKVVASDWGTESFPEWLNSTVCFKKDRGKTASAARGTVELKRLFQKDRGKKASAARIMSPNPA